MNVYNSPSFDFFKHCSIIFKHFNIKKYIKIITKKKKKLKKKKYIYI